MPRVNLGRDPTKERQEATRRIIRRGMAEQGIQYGKNLALKMGISAPALSCRISACSFNLDELVRLCKVLHLTEQDAAVILGIRKH
jgi:hypothetical protein